MLREHAYVAAVLEGLPPGAPVLDLGCGTGRPMVEYITAKGHEVTGVDQSMALLAIARARMPAAAWVACRIEDFEPSGKFAAIMCWDALFHIQRREHERLFARFRRMLVDGGRVMLTVGGSTHPAFTDTMFGETFFYDSFPPETVMEMLAAAGFEPIIAEFMNPPTSGRDKGRFAIVARVAPNRA